MAAVKLAKKADLTAETAAREAADTTLDTRLDAVESARLQEVFVSDPQFGSGFQTGATAAQNVTSFNAAMAYAIARQATAAWAVRIPVGEWSINAELVYSPSVSIWGAGVATTTLRASTDFGAGKYLLRPSAVKGRRSSYRDFFCTGPTVAAPPFGSPPNEMHGFMLPGGGTQVDNVECQRFNRGMEGAADHFALHDCFSKTNYINFYFGFDRNQEADQYFTGCDFSSAYYASVGVAGSNVMGGITMESCHLGYCPYGIVKESSVPTVAAPTLTPVGSGSTGSPFTAGGTFHYVVAAVFNDVSETLISADASVVVAAGGSVGITWAAVTGAASYNLYRDTAAITSGNTARTKINVVGTTSYTDTGPQAGAQVPIYGNGAAVSGCTFIDSPCEAFSHGFIYCENQTTPESVIGNDFRNSATANPFTADFNMAGRAKKAVVDCGDFDGNIISGSLVSLFQTPGSDSDGCVILATALNSGNLLDTSALLPASGKPFWVTRTGTTVPTFRVRTAAKSGRYVKLNSGSIAAGQLVGAELSNGRMAVYPTSQTPATRLVEGVAAEAATAGIFLIWTEGAVSLTSTDGTVNNVFWVKPSTTVAGEVTKAAGPWDSAIAASLAGVAGSTVSARLLLGPATVPDPAALLATAIDAKGDLLVGSAADAVVRKAVGTNGQVLQADSAVAGGIKWADASGGTPQGWLATIARC